MSQRKKKRRGRKGRRDYELRIRIDDNRGMKERGKEGRNK